MQINTATLRALNQGFNAAFMQGFDSLTPSYSLIAMEIPSTSDAENYGWMKELPGMREWIGSRVINNLEATSAKLVNKHYEHTIGVDRNAILDDKLGQFKLQFNQQGEIARRHPDQLVWGLLPLGLSVNGFDGQYYFDTDHEGYDATGAVTSYANLQAGAGNPWFLCDLRSTYMKPLIFQNRQNANFVSLTGETDETVFLNRKYLFGVDARYAAGFGFHQLAYASRATLDATNFKAARLAMQTQKRPDGTPLPIMPSHLICGPSNQSAAEDLINTSHIGGTANTLYKAVELIVSPWLA